jgi:hypothetical protein
MVFIPFGKVLGSVGESLVRSCFVPFVFECDEYAKEPSFLITGCEVRPGEAREWHRSMMVGVWSRWGVPKVFPEFPVCSKDSGDGEGVWNWSACLMVNPILQSQSETFVSARFSRHGWWVVFQNGQLESEGRSVGVEGSG